MRITLSVTRSMTDPAHYSYWDKTVSKANHVVLQLLITGALHQSTFRSLYGFEHTTEKKEINNGIKCGAIYHRRQQNPY